MKTLFRSFTRTLLRNPPLWDHKIFAGNDIDLKTRNLYPQHLINWDRLSQISLELEGLSDD